MSSQFTSQNGYVGSRALFDPYFVPNELIGLEKEQKRMKSILNDAIEDQYPITLSLYGLRGVGKTTLTRKTFSELQSNNSNVQNNFHSCYVNCCEKDLVQIVFSLIDNLSSSVKYELPPESILNASLGSQINLLSHLITKFHTQNDENSIIFFLDSIEYTQPTLINKIMDVCSSQSCFLVTSFNLLKNSPYLMEFKKPDMQIQLNTYNPSILEQICLDRCRLAFKQSIDPTMIQYITDMASEFDYRVPESCLRVLRELYPLIENESYIDPDQIQDVCRYQFKGYSIDEISVAEFISETEIIDRLFLDEINSFFQSQSRYYVSFIELLTMYKIACEGLEFPFSEMRFRAFLDRTQKIGLLQASNFNKHAKKPQNSQYLEGYLFFLSLSPHLFSEILDVSFGQFGFSFE